MRTIVMKNEITFLQQPVTVDVNEWLLNNSGLVAVAEKLEDKTKATIIAFQRSDMATVEMKKLANEKNGIILISTSDGDINAID